MHLQTFWCTFKTALLQLSMLSASSLLLVQEEEAARAYDRSLVRLRGITAATNFALSDYKHDLHDYHAMQQVGGGVVSTDLSPVLAVRRAAVGGCKRRLLLERAATACRLLQRTVCNHHRRSAACDGACQCPRVRSCPAAVGAAE